MRLLPALSTSLLFLLVLMAGAPAIAESAKAPRQEDGPDSPKAQAQAGTAPLEEIVHGAYAQMRAGGGYMVKSSSIDPNPTFPQLAGQSESMGAGTEIDFALGYDVADSLGLQLVGGMAAVSGRRQDWVRGLSLGYGGAGLRLSMPMGDRLNLVVAPSFVYCWQSLAVEKPTVGVGVMASVGFEYQVHVRHFSLGADLNVLVPMTPLRAFVGVVPHIRYTF
ncbi:MAG TPA: hypothetical protein VFH51_03215 [Myxococcota bacterium]|nr:hypothetical protein [Myxococcota bacterium]